MYDICYLVRVPIFEEEKNQVMNDTIHTSTKLLSNTVESIDYSFNLRCYDGILVIPKNLVIVSLYKKHGTSQCVINRIVLTFFRNNNAVAIK
jgi:hypothetical protein